jgi:gluconokinase
MPPGLLRSQFEALDPLDADEKGVTVAVDASPEEITRRALAAVVYG